MPLGGGLYSGLVAKRQYTFDELVVDKKARDSLPLPQLHAFVEKVVALTKGLGTHNIPSNPADLAHQLTGGKWYHAPHLDYLSSKLVALSKRQIEGLIVCMPPRHGKSTLIDVYFPTWWLARNPMDQVAMAGYGENFARDWGGKVRDIIIEHGAKLNLEVRKDKMAADEWRLTSGGGMLTVGVEGGLTGKGANLLIIDDPIKNEEEALSKVYRERIWNWWQATASTRMEPGGVFLIVACLTGDTPILRGDGTETPLRAIRPGDAVATYVDGEIAEATVKHWINHGPDRVFAIRTKSGSLVKANARHPFLVERAGVIEWRRTATLRKGDAILKATGVSGVGLSAQQMGVPFPSAARDSAPATTTRNGGKKGFVHHLSTRVADVMHTCAAATASALRNTLGFLLPKQAGVVFAGSPLLGETHELGSSSSIIATRRAGSAGCFATSATSLLATGEHQSFSKQQQRIYAVIPDPIESITDAGVEDVFDIQVDPTENFIANGLVSHNTRWHEDDLIGRLLNDMPPNFEVVSFPALAGESDILGREPGEMLWPQRFYDDPNYAKRRFKLTDYWWSALYQQRPSPEGGGILKEDDWQFYHALPEGIDQWIQSWELSLKDTALNDFSVGQVWARKGASNYLVKSVRGHFSLQQVADHMRAFTREFPKALAKLVEDTALGPALKQTLQHEVAGIVPIIPKGSKRSRAEAIVPLMQAHNVYVPGDSVNDCPKWVKDLIGECSSFPKGTHDDQVDTTTQALAYLQPSVWHHDAEVAEKAKEASMPEMTPPMIRKTLFQQQIDKMKKATDKRYAPRRRLRAMW